MRVKCIDNIAKIVQLGSNIDQCYIQKCVVTNRVIKRSRFNLLYDAVPWSCAPKHYLTVFRLEEKP